MAVNVGQRNVKDTPQNRGLISLNKALNLSVHTIKICSNPKVFDEKYQKFVDKTVVVRLIYLCQRIQLIIFV